MATGFGTRTQVSRCYPALRELVRCKQLADESLLCTPYFNDYINCLSLRTETKREQHRRMIERKQEWTLRNRVREELYDLSHKVAEDKGHGHGHGSGHESVQNNENENESE
eukprot:TRINITY_DN8093_c0_g1_i1.p1 TRINITY_DN8093_c0_g1~~TRINITY_DN8093_c0_g1_i1.p1  ORF type:complete len:111 (+),score=15.40 TRINITY_DN8093_c0_g1_i1:49-381(+)